MRSRVLVIGSREKEKEEKEKEEKEKEKEKEEKKKIPGIGRYPMGPTIKRC